MNVRDYGEGFAPTEEITAIIRLPCSNGQINDSLTEELGAICSHNGDQPYERGN
jgi:hypothetical protein